MYVEDQVSQKGPIHLEVSPTMTVLQLKQKVQRELGIPTDVQRWILGKKLATDDNKTLELNDIKHDFCPVFLYLVTPGSSGYFLHASGVVPTFNNSFFLYLACLSMLISN